MYSYYKLENGDLYRVKGSRWEILSLSHSFWNTVLYQIREEFIKGISPIMSESSIELSEKEMNIEINKLKMINELKK